MRLLSASLGPLMCRTLDHLLCPAGTSAVRCSVRPPAALQHGGSGWKARAEHGRATRTPGPRGHKHWAATLLKLITAQVAIGSDTLGQGQSATETSPSRAGSLLRPSPETQRLRPAQDSENSKDAALSPRQPGKGTLDGVTHFLSLVRSKKASPPPAKAVPQLGTYFSVPTEQNPDL